MVDDVANGWVEIAGYFQHIAIAYAMEWNRLASRGRVTSDQPMVNLQFGVFRIPG